MIEPILLSVAALIVAMQTTNRVFTGTNSHVASGVACLVTISGFMWVAGYPLLGLAIAVCIILLAIR